MKKPAFSPVVVNTITDLHRLNGLPDPEHPSVSIVRFNDIRHSPTEYSQGCVLGFFLIAIKKDLKGKLRYGQKYYDFDEGVMSFMAPGQLCYEEPSDRPASGFMLMVHPDFLRGHSLEKDIRELEYFSYAINEALYLSKKEERLVESILEHIEQEYQANIDNYSQPVILSQIELLLAYSSRFYNRQFITRKISNNDLLQKLESLLHDHFNDSSGKPLPTVKTLAAAMNVSPGYLSDMLRVHTGTNTQQHIHQKMIDKAKQLLAGQTLSVAEIAYQLGFEHPQSFTKIFRRKTNLTPKEFRSSIN